MTGCILTRRVEGSSDESTNGTSEQVVSDLLRFGLDDVSSGSFSLCQKRDSLLPWA